ncbi:alpha/beta fold hydrolase [Aeromicrobium sp. 636]|uniref:Alpha/beta hydrolase n=1 Tax=Aeromicrobium senzhongii TaxID=2663859 RepID=A0A8I0JZR3_9ACTN|nr:MULTISPECIES: alpha/beta hydrolase [Aeromicrobium]MBC9226267.1 alpha/beta hydrolase [Aeromicrobium senzhongii]MCQ3998373.1 alpha/beta fold hydrolase [Aeromicrobium sp. 636]MTB88802.1 alpha/beta fold hydrolase [Aeromicrobium senzhongii]QNL93909.1 alpha/beta hydrolase [Aeromicrobium senzhongii]
MDIVLVPGFWLDASSWDAVTPQLVEAGHRIHPLTLPGLESRDASRAGIGLADHIDFVAGKVDSLDGDVVLVGHSGGGAVIHGVADRRPDRIARNIYVDSGPPAEGQAVNDELPADGDEIPLPPWDEFMDMDLVDLDDQLRAEFIARAVPLPRRVATDGITLTDERRLDVPVTVIANEFPSQILRDAIAAGEPWVGELGRVRDVEYVDLPTGHWPQFTKPAELGAAIVEALRDR